MLPVPKIKSKTLNDQLLKEMSEKSTENEKCTISKRLMNKLYELWKLHSFLSTDTDIKKILEIFNNYIENDTDKPTKSEITELYALNIHIIDCIGYILLKTDIIEELMNIDKYADKTPTQIKEIEFKQILSDIKNDEKLDTIEKIDKMIDNIDLTAIANDTKIKNLVNTLQKPNKKQRKKKGNIN